MQTLSDFEQDIIDAVIDWWHDRVCMPVGYFKHMQWNEFYLRGSSEDFYTVNALWCI